MSTLRFRAWWTGLEKMTTEFSIAADGTVYSKAGNKLFDGEIVVMQSTGLTDKYGVELFEGDVVRDGNGQGTVVWVPATAAFCVEVTGSPHRFYGLNRLDTSRPTQLQETEVIGNIHQNPGLLPERGSLRP